MDRVPRGRGGRELERKEEALIIWGHRGGNRVLPLG